MTQTLELSAVAERGSRHRFAPMLAPTAYGPDRRLMGKLPPDIAYGLLDRVIDAPGSWLLRRRAEFRTTATKLASTTTSSTAGQPESRLFGSTGTGQTKPCSPATLTKRSMPRSPYIRSAASCAFVSAPLVWTRSAGTSRLALGAAAESLAATRHGLARSLPEATRTTDPAMDARIHGKWEPHATRTVAQSAV